VVLIAKNAAKSGHDERTLSRPKIHKEYTALVHGTPGPEQWIINKPISRDPSYSIKSKFKIDDSGKEAISHIIQCERVGTSYSRLLIAPLTGRTHQLRVHCAGIGHPIAGDILYGSDINTTARELTDLHALPAVRFNRGMLFTAFGLYFIIHGSKRSF
jgi:23S rRNA-/tRNA-specific pseudouridylate synthase